MQKPYLHDNYYLYKYAFSRSSSTKYTVLSYVGVAQWHLQVAIAVYIMDVQKCSSGGLIHAGGTSLCGHLK